MATGLFKRAAMRSDDAASALLRIAAENSSPDVDDGTNAPVTSGVQHGEMMEEEIGSKVVRSGGESFRVKVTPLVDGILLEGASGLVAGEHALLVLQDSQLRDIVIRWAVGDQAGAKFIG